METSSRPPYCYTALPSNTHVRVLEIQHDINENSPLKGRLRTIDLHDDARIPYAALSYTWGQPEFSEELLLDDTIKFITPNLANALYRFRSVGHIRWIWADAICINQEDDEEKSLQIPLMGKIYHDASYVMVWLGNQSQSIQSMKAVRAAAARVPENRQDLRTFSQEVLPHVTNITQLPWFTRRWIIQEITLNPTVSFHCGSVELSWQRFSEVVYMARVMLPPVPSVDSAISLWRLWIEWSLPRIETALEPAQSSPETEAGFASMATLLHAFSGFDCSDPRDLIYSIFGLQKDQFSIDINYAYSTEDVFINFAEAYSNAKSRTRNLLFWILAERTTRHNGNNGGGLPSWIPDWRIPPVGRLPFELRPVVGQLIRKSSNSSSHILTNMNHLQNPATLERDKAPLTVASVVVRGENERLLDFLVGAVEAIERRHSYMYGFSLSWIEGSVTSAVSAFIPTETFRRAQKASTTDVFPDGVRVAKLREILRYSRREDQAVSLNIERLEATCRCIFVGIPNYDSKPNMSNSSIGIGFSSIRTGDSIFISSARLTASTGDVSRDRLRAGLVLREMPQLRQDKHSTRTPYSYEFVGCCCVGPSHMMGSWMCYLSDIEIY